MNGIRNIDLCLAAMICATCGMASADVVRLKNDSRLTGDVVSIHNDGSVDLKSILSPELLEIKGESVERVVFENPATPSKAASTLVELVNGDTIPCTVSAYDGNTLSVDSQFLGKLDIKKESVKSIHAGIIYNKTVYSGPNSLEEWNRKQLNVSNWTYEDGVLTCNASGELKMDPETPQHFILKFTLGWQGQPNFKISFADPLLEIGKPADRYFLQYGNAGLEIKRESTAGRRYTTIVQLNRTPDQYPENTINIEIRVDRKESLIHLSINGEPEGRYKDQVAGPPAAGGISITANAPNGTSQQISKFQLIEWNLSKDRHLTEDRGDPKTDALILRGGDRFGGRLKSVRQSEDGMVYNFKSDFQDDPLEIPEAEVSTLFFASPEKQANAEKPPSNIHLKLGGNGSLQFQSCTFDTTHAIAEHSLLGKLQVVRSGIISLEHQDNPPKAKPVP